MLTFNAAKRHNHKKTEVDHQDLQDLENSRKAGYAGSAYAAAQDYQEQSTLSQLLRHSTLLINPNSNRINFLSLLFTATAAFLLQLPLIIAIIYFLQFRIMANPNTDTQILGSDNTSSNLSNFVDQPLKTIDTIYSINPLATISNSPPPPPNLAPPPPSPSLKAHGMPHYAFVQMSSYRASPNTFYVIGITSVFVRQHGPPVYSCEWHPNNATHDLDDIPLNPTTFDKTDAKMIYIGYDENGELYVPAIVNCTFDKDVGVDGYGGILALSLFLGTRYIKDTHILAKIEPRGEALEILKSTYKYEYAYCSPPVHRVDRPNWLLQWLTYHHYIFEGKGHFFFYDVGGLTMEARAFLLPFLDAGILTIIQVHEQKEYISWYHNQLLWINDCLHRNRKLAKWVVFHDFDEFLDVQPPKTLRSLLEEYNDAPWITYGNIPSLTGYCRLPTYENEWDIERLLCREKQPECMDKAFEPWAGCLASKGRRKYIARSEKVIATGVHKVAIPEEGGINLNASIARVYHYRSALSKNVRPCGISVNISNTQPPCFRDDSFAKISKDARTFASNILKPYNFSST